MKKSILILLLSVLCHAVFGQNSEAAEKLIIEGIASHDKGEYNEAIAKYDEALKLDKNNIFALAEKAISLLALQKYDESIQCCQKAISAHSDDDELKAVYVTYGNALDGLNKTNKSIEIYNEGIKRFPNYYQLYFNKGVSLSMIEKYDEAIECLQKSIILNPEHASSHNAIARLLNYKHKRIPSLLAYCRFLAIEPQGNRAFENLASMEKIMAGNVEKTGKNSVNVTINPDMLADTTGNGKIKENDFSSTDLLLSMDAAMDFDKKNKNKTRVEQFIRKFNTLCASLKETRKNNVGFFWDYYVPYFTEMKEKNLIETYAYIAFASSDDKDVEKWLNAHKSEIDQFFEWSNSFEWKK